MSGNNQGYGSYSAYNPSGNPFAEQGSDYRDQPSYGSRPQAQEQGSSYYTDVEQGGFEMRNVNGTNPNGRNQSDILTRVEEFKSKLRLVDEKVQNLREIWPRYMNDTNTSNQSTYRDTVEKLQEQIMGDYKKLVNESRSIKADPAAQESRYAPQVRVISDNLKKAMFAYQNIEKQFRQQSQEQMARQYRIVRPDASADEIREATEDPNNQQIFSMALIQSDRRGQAQTAARNVSQRHDDIQKIERQMIELAQLFQDLEAMVVQQEPAVTQIEQRGEEVTEHVAKANTELTGAVEKARAARRKKWWCLGIVVLIIIVIVIIVVVVVKVT